MAMRHFYYYTTALMSKDYVVKLPSQQKISTEINKESNISRSDSDIDDTNINYSSSASK